VHNTPTPQLYPLSLHDALPISDVPDPAAHVQYAVTAAPYQHLARVLVFAPADAVVEQFPPTYGTVTELRPSDHPDGPACRLETRSEEHTSELQSRENLVCRLLL